MSKEISTQSSPEITQFLQDMQALQPARNDGERGRLIFAMDATASREPSWDRAIQVQSEMFVEADRLGGLSVQLVFYRGFGECKASRWTHSARDLVDLMVKVRCLAGRTQIGRVLRQAIKENGKAKVNALVLVTDACEEEIDELGHLAGQLSLFGTPVFAFQDGGNPAASRALSNIAKLTNGAHLHLRDGSPAELRALLQAVASYAAGGNQALKQLAQRSKPARLLLQRRS